jgi:hypothetical protein
MKVLDLYNVKESLERISKLDLPIRAAFKVVRLIEKLNKEFVVVEPLRQKLFEKYGEKAEDLENAMRIKEENKPAFQKEWEELLLTEMNLDFVPLRAEEFGEDTKIQPQDLMNLQPFMERELDEIE